MLRHEPAARGLVGMDLLRARIRRADVPAPTAENLRLATWNVRLLGKGRRFDESIRMIARIIRCFDLVAIVELQDDITDMRRVLAELGPHWQIVFSDYLLDAGGNRERVGFVFDARRIAFTGLASSAMEPRRRVVHEYHRVVPWWRPPFLASFRAARRDFILVAAHVRWGETAAQRRSEAELVARWVVGRARERFFGDKDVLVVGDFNVLTAPSDAHPWAGLVAAPGIVPSVTSSLAANKRYDQILCLPENAEWFSGRAGAVDFYAGEYASLLPGRRLTKAAFTYQLSDHLPLWAELRVR